MKQIKNIYSVGHRLLIDEVVDLENLLTIPALTIEEKHNPSLDEGYHIRIMKEYSIHIEYGHSRALKYAKRALKELIAQQSLPMGLIEDAPSMKMRGIIEGFYGTPWTHADRLDVIRFIDEEDMNTYIYAPKDDLYHRDKWRLPYPKEDFDRLLALIEESKKRDVDFYFSISPGKDFNYTKKEDFSVLFEKVDAIIAHGVTHFCLLLDDIDYQLKGNDLTQFESPGKAHAYISNQLHAHIKEQCLNPTFIMCPTEYWQNTDTPYRQDIKEHLDEDVLVFWTGYNTIAEFIPNIDGKHVREYFGHELVLWDNYPVNDMTNDLMFMGPLENRGDALHETHVGMVANPMIEWSLSKISLLTMSEYMWHPGGYRAEESFQAAIKHFSQDETFEKALYNVAKNFRYSIIHYYPIDDLEKAVKEKNMAYIQAYYKQFVADCEQLKQFHDQRFIEQIEPWINRVKFDALIVDSLVKKTEETTKELIAQIPQKEHTVGSNIATKLVKELGLYDGDVYKRYRINFWE